MRKYIIKRILLSIVILFFVALIIYTLMRCLPTSYIEAMARQKSMQPGSKSVEEWMDQLTKMYNMDKGIIPGYFAWLGSLFRGDFGDSWKWTVPVVEKFHDTVWVSFVMGDISFVLELLIAIPAALPVKNWLQIRVEAREKSGSRAAAVTLALGPKVLAFALLGCSVVRLLSSTFRSFLYFQF